MEETEEAARLALTKLFATRLRAWQGNEDLIPGVAASLDMLRIALDVYGQLNCWIMAEDAETSDEEAVEMLTENAMGVMKLAITDNIAELRRIGRSAAFDEN
jgi:hypothetical protein